MGTVLEELPQKKSSIAKCQQFIEWKQEFSKQKIYIFLKYPLIFHYQTDHFFVHQPSEKTPDYVILKPFWVRLLYVNQAISFDSTSARMWLLFTSDSRNRNAKCSKNANVKKNNRLVYITQWRMGYLEVWMKVLLRAIPLWKAWSSANFNRFCFQSQWL